MYNRYANTKWNFSLPLCQIHIQAHCSIQPITSMCQQNWCFAVGLQRCSLHSLQVYWMCALHMISGHWGGGHGLPKTGPPDSCRTLILGKELGWKNLHAFQMRRIHYWQPAVDNNEVRGWLKYDTFDCRRREMQYSSPNCDHSMWEWAQ